MSTPIGSVCHVELFAKDLDQSARFYSELFGWTTFPHDEGYMMWEDPAGLGGGFTAAGGPTLNSAATIYMKVEDIQATLARIVIHGGVIIREKTEIGGNNGFYALFRDPAGNNVGLWSSI